MTDEEFLTAYEATTFPYQLWTHRAHVRLGFLFLKRAASFNVALDAIRGAIQAYNAVNREKVRRGYHETLTYAFLSLIAAAMRSAPDATGGDAESFIDANPELLDQTILGRYYSTEVLRDERSRIEFVLPDLQPLPSSDA